MGSENAVIRLTGITKNYRMGRESLAALKYLIEEFGGNPYADQMSERLFEPHDYLVSASDEGQRAVEIR